MSDEKRVFGLFAFYRAKEGAVPLTIAYAIDASSFNWLKRGFAVDGVKFCAREVTQRTKILNRACVEQNEYKCLSFVDNDNIACAIVVTKNYDERPGYSALGKTLQFIKNSEIYKKFKSTWPAADKDMAYKELESGMMEIMKQYMDPLKADKLLAIKYELEETKQIMYKNIEDLLESNERLEDLVQKSRDIADLSKGIARKSKDLNRCCTIL